MKKIIIICIAAFAIVACAKKNVSYYIVNGNKYLTEKKINYAIQEFSSALKIEPQNPQAYYYRAIAYSLDKKPDSAIDDYTSVLKLNNKYPSAYCNRGFIYLYNNKRLGLAFSDFTSEI